MPTILGLTGGFLPPWGLPPQQLDARIPLVSPGVFHDAAAVLVQAGRVIAGMEEERLNRIKHTNRVPVYAIRSCLALSGLSMRDIDLVAYYGRESGLDRAVADHMLSKPQIAYKPSAREYLAGMLTEDIGTEMDPSRIVFVEHHLSHASSAYRVSPYSDALVVTLDGQGDGLSGSVWSGSGGRLTRLRDIADTDSLGLLYLRTIQYLGYGLFDEYKVMGLAPYGNPAVYRRAFGSVCELMPKGAFAIHLENTVGFLECIGAPRRVGEPLRQEHVDIAAALQETVEQAALHTLCHFQTQTGHRNMCLAGGIALNSVLAGKIRKSGLFDGVFVQPAAHDAGCALGAALEAHAQLERGPRIEGIAHMYWGRDIGCSDEVRERLRAWSEVVWIRPLADAAAEAARLIAERGAVIGWVQGRSEFGPRALGNRSILADPRIAANKDRVNDLVKEREAYRPFAPAVMWEYASEYFDVPPEADLPFMTFTVQVLDSARRVLAATTHVDGSARVQTVSRSTNERFWRLLDEFRKLTGVPVVLNTSFNHSVEPIVDTIDDAVTCFLTTGMDYMIVGDYLVTKREVTACHTWNLSLVLAVYVRLTHATQKDASGHLTNVFTCDHTANPAVSRSISQETYELLTDADGCRSVNEITAAQGTRISDQTSRELRKLWGERLLLFVPRTPARTRLPGVAELRPVTRRTQREGHT